MNRRITIVTALVLGLASPILAAGPDPSLLGYWKLDGDALDSSGNGRHGTLMGNAHFIPDGAWGQALSLDGNGDYVNIAGFQGINATNGVQHAFTVANWFRTTFDSGDKEMVTWGTNSGTMRLSWRVYQGLLRTEHGSGNLMGTTLCNDGEWHHAALAVAEGANLRVPATTLYLDGVQEAITGGSNTAYNLTANLDVRIGMGGPSNGRYWLGDLDEVRIYDRALTAAEVKELAVHAKAFHPSPANGAQDASTPLLTWQPAEHAQLHDVYLGTDPNLTDADRVATQLMSPMYWHLPGLTPGITYYWRVDEIDPDGTVHTGEVWSFFYAPTDAYHPVPADGEPFVDPNLTLNWLKGAKAVTHDVYFGTDRTAVADGTGGTFKGNQVPLSFTPGVLSADTWFYWRIDEVLVDGTKVKGNVWSFKTLPVIAPAADARLMGWWTFDEGAGSRAVDWSGHGRHGTLNPAGSPTWVAGYDGSALSFDGQGSGDYVTVHNYAGILGNNPFTIALWLKSTSTSAVTMVNWGATAGGQRIDFRLAGGRLCVEHGSGTLQGNTVLTDGEWHHAACVISRDAALQSPDIAIYLDGLEDTAATTDPDKFNITAAIPVTIGQRRTHNDREFLGEIDDVRIYDDILWPEDIEMMMVRFNPLRAWQPYPADGAWADVRWAVPLAWSKGNNASKHDVYFGTDAAVVAAADAADATGVYRGRVSDTSFTPAENVAQNRQYFWRVDEINADGSITGGRVWSFTVADYLIVEDFESYNDVEPTRVFDVWIGGDTDGLSNSLVGLYPDAINGTFCNTTIVHGGRQSMPMDYDNSKSPFFSEAAVTFAPLQNWTGHEVDTLSLCVQGTPPVAYMDQGNGAFIVSGSGHDIWNDADDFRFVYQKLSGDGSIVVKVENLGGSNVWAKAGVMIRESLDAGSPMAYMIVSYAQGVSFGRRETAGANGITTNTPTVPGIRTPQWVKLTRTGDVFTAQYSDDGQTWLDVRNPVLTGDISAPTVTMPADVYIGLCVTSHDSALATTAAFSGTATTGNVTGAWQVAWIGDDPDLTTPAAAAGFYVAVEDSTGKKVTVSDPLLANLAMWSQWKIPLSRFTGVNMSRVKKLYLGVGNRTAPVADGTGHIYLDDIQIIKGTPAPGAP